MYENWEARRSSGGQHKGCPKLLSSASRMTFLKMFRDYTLGCHLNNNCLGMLMLRWYRLTISNKRFYVQLNCFFCHNYSLFESLSLCYTTRQCRYSDCIPSLFRIRIENDRVAIFIHSGTLLIPLFKS